MEKTEITSIASLSPELAWKLLTPEEQRQMLKYLEKVREQDKKTHKKQEEPLVTMG